MINIFNLFLFLCALWFLLSFSSNNLTTEFMIAGSVISALISLASWKLKIINKHFNFLFLNLGFYKHFLGIFIVSFFRLIPFLVKNTFTNKTKNCCVYEINQKKILNRSELSLFIATITFIPGIAYLGRNKDNIIIYATSEDLFNNSSIKTIYNNINQINDDQLV
jgi:hypothetical protein